MVQRAMVIAPGSRMGPATPDERNSLINHSPLYGKYDSAVDRESAFEMLQQACRPQQPMRRPAKAIAWRWMTAFWAG